MQEANACWALCLRIALLILLESIAAGDLQKDLTAFMKECFFKDPALAAQHSRSRGGKGMFDKQYGVRCSTHHCNFMLCNSCHCAQAADLGCSIARRTVTSYAQDCSNCSPQGALQQLVLRRCLSLVLLLDCAAQRQGVLNDSTPLLFRLSVKPKLESSAEVRQMAPLAASDGLMNASVMPRALPWMGWHVCRSILQAYMCICLQQKHSSPIR